MTGENKSIGDLDAYTPVAGDDLVVLVTGGVTKHATVDDVLAVGLPGLTPESIGAQPLDDELTAIAALPSDTDTLPYFTGAGAAALTDLTALARTLLAGASSSVMRGVLGIGTSFNVMDSTYGAVGDGVTDDTAAIEACVADAAAAGAAVYMPGGTYLVSWFENPTIGTSLMGCIFLRNGQMLYGDGPGKTIIKLANDQDSYGSANMIINDRPDLITNTNITVRDLMVDGNGAEQDTLYQGIVFFGVSGLVVENVVVQNVRGTGNAPPDETFHFSISDCINVRYSNCVAQGTDGTQGTGFGANHSTNVLRVNCVARAMSEGMGFAEWESANVTNVGCAAYFCGTTGFNVEITNGYALVGCHVGGVFDEGGAFGTAFSSMGNNYGVVINATTRATIIGCVIDHNTGHGINVVDTAGVHGEVIIDGCWITNNGTNAGDHAIRFADSGCRTASFVGMNNKIAGNFGSGAIVSDSGAIDVTETEWNTRVAAAWAPIF